MCEASVALAIERSAPGSGIFGICTSDVSDDPLTWHFWRYLYIDRATHTWYTRRQRTVTRHQDASEDAQMVTKMNARQERPLLETWQDVPRREKALRRDEIRDEKRDETRWLVLRGWPPHTADPPGGSGHSPLFSHRFSDLVFDRLFLDVCPNVGSFWSTFHVFYITFSSIEFASIFDWLFIDFWYPWSCKKRF